MYIIPAGGRSVEAKVTQIVNDVTTISLLNKSMSGVVAAIAETAAVFTILIPTIIMLY